MTHQTIHQELRQQFINRTEINIAQTPPLLIALCERAFQSVQLNRLLPGIAQKAAVEGLDRKDFALRIFVSLIWEMSLWVSSGFIPYYARCTLLEELEYEFYCIEAREEAYPEVFAAIIREMEKYISSKEGGAADVQRTSQWLAAVKFILQSRPESIG